MAKPNQTRSSSSSNDEDDCTIGAVINQELKELFGVATDEKANKIKIKKEPTDTKDSGCEKKEQDGYEDRPKEGKGRDDRDNKCRQETAPGKAPASVTGSKFKSALFTPEEAKLRKALNGKARRAAEEKRKMALAKATARLNAKRKEMSSLEQYIRKKEESLEGLIAEIGDLEYSVEKIESRGKKRRRGKRDAALGEEDDGDEEEEETRSKFVDEAACVASEAEEEEVEEPCQKPKKQQKKEKKAKRKKEREEAKEWYEKGAAAHTDSAEATKRVMGAPTFSSSSSSSSDEEGGEKGEKDETKTNKEKEKEKENEEETVLCAEKENGHADDDHYMNFDVNALLKMLDDNIPCTDSKERKYRSTVSEWVKSHTPYAAICNHIGGRDGTCSKLEYKTADPTTGMINQTYALYRPTSVNRAPARSYRVAIYDSRNPLRNPVVHTSSLDSAHWNKEIKEWVDLFSPSNVHPELASAKRSALLFTAFLYAEKRGLNPASLFLPCDPRPSIAFSS